MGAGAAGVLVKHLPLTAASCLAVVTSLQLLWVSSGNQSTARAILQAGGTATTVYAGLTSLMPTLLGVSASLWVGLHIGRDRRKPGPLAVMIGVVSLLLVFSVVPAVLCVAFMAAVAVAVLRRTDDSDEEDDVRKLRSAPWVFAVALVFAFLGTGPWWPAEQIERRSGGDIHGYVVGADPRELVVLTGTSHLIIHVPRADVVGRRVCETTSSWELNGPSPFVMLFGRRHPPCD